MQQCKDDTAYRRHIFFFAHNRSSCVLFYRAQGTAGVLRWVPYAIAPAADGCRSSGVAINVAVGEGVSESLSPSMSPDATAMRRASWAVNEVLALLRKLQFGKVKPVPEHIGFPLGFGTPRCSNTTTSGGLCSLLVTPTIVVNGFG